TDATGDGTFSGETGGIIKSFGNNYDCTKSNLKLLTQNDTSADNIDCYEASTRDEKVPATYKTKVGGTVYNNFDTAEDMYEYSVDTPEQAKEKVQKYAGRIDGGDLKWEFDNETEDKNYSIIPEFKSAVTNYKGSVIKIGGVAVSGGTTTGGPTGSEGEGGDEEGGKNPPATVDGEVKLIPMQGTSGFTVEGSAKSHSAITVAGVEIPKNGALKMDSSASITFTTTEEMTLTLYLLNNKTVNIDDVASSTPTQSGDVYVLTVTLAAGSHSITKGGGENSLYLLVLTPKS
ncbi:MAG: pectate lyase, partial [Clostridia bacterium]|nr:pectate lyase [Clostridia bacterium]